MPQPGRSSAFAQRRGPHVGADAQHGKEVAADEKPSRHARSGAAVESKFDIGPRQNAGEGVLMIAELLPQRIGEEGYIDARRSFHRVTSASSSRTICSEAGTGNVRIRMASSS